jgi:phosphoribosylformylglycinamidine cyclo-ligase
VSQPDLNADFHGRPLGDVLMEPTHLYVKPLLSLMSAVEVKGMAHITGGGLVENVPRVLRSHLMAKLDRSAWEMPPLFTWLQQHGNVAESEMHRVFNCGIGMVVIVSKDVADQAMAHLRTEGEVVSRIGEIHARVGDEAQTIVA